MKYAFFSILISVILISGCIDQIENSSGKAIGVRTSVLETQIEPTNKLTSPIQGQFIQKNMKKSPVLTVGKQIASDRILVKFRSDANIKQPALASFKIKNMALTSSSIQKNPSMQVKKLFDDSVFDKSLNPEMDDNFIITVPQDKLFDYLTTLNRDSSVEYAEPDYIFNLAAIPNDPSFSTYQWAINSTIQTQTAWEITTGDPNTVIAVLDTGFDFAHSDLSSKYTGVGYRYDFVNHDADPTYNLPAGDCASFVDHGTAVSGVIAAATNNGNGIAGVCWNCKIMPIKVCGGQYCTCYYSSIINGINYAKYHGAMVISMSFTYDCVEDDPKYSCSEQMQLMNQTVIEAENLGVVLVAATPNAGNVDTSYPAAFSQVFAVGSTNINDAKADRNYGYKVDGMAPGSDILTTVVQNNYNYMSGTSMATPHVAGLAGLLFSKFPFLQPWQVRDYIKSGEDNIGLFVGRINAKKTLINACSVYGPCCGDGSCEINKGETYLNCPKDCCESDCTAVNDKVCHSECTSYKGCATIVPQCNGQAIYSAQCLDNFNSISCCSTLKNCGQDINGNRYQCVNNYCQYPGGGGGSPILYSSSNTVREPFLIKAEIQQNYN